MSPGLIPVHVAAPRPTVVMQSTLAFFSAATSPIG